MAAKGLYSVKVGRGNRYQARYLGRYETRQEAETYRRSRHAVYPDEYTKVVRLPTSANPPKGWIPVRAVKIERKGGMVKVRIRK